MKKIEDIIQKIDDYSIFAFANRKTEVSNEHLYGPGARVNGPYTKANGRKVVVIKNDLGERLTMSYPRFVVEQFLGRRLDKDLETIDHWDTNFDNNDITNLHILPRKMHSAEDTRRVKMVKLKCSMCGKRFERSPRIIRDKAKKGSRGYFCSKSCSGKYARLRQLGKIDEFDVQEARDSVYYKKKYSSILSLAKSFLKFAQSNNLQALNAENLSKFFHEKLTSEDADIWVELNSSVLNDPRITGPWEFEGRRFVAPIDEDTELELYTRRGEYTKKSKLLQTGGIVKQESFVNEVNLFEVPNFVGHNGVLYEAMSFLVFGTSKLTNLPDTLLFRLKQYIEFNSESVKDVMKYLSRSPRLLGNGIDGVAFSLGNSIVLKVFTRPATYNEVKLAHKRLLSGTFSGSTEITIYDYGEFKEFANIPNLYFVVMEEVDEIKKDSLQDLRKFLYWVKVKITEAKAAGKFNVIIGNKVEPLQNHVDDPEYYDRFEDVVEEVASEISVRSDLDQDIANSITNITRSYNSGVGGNGQLVRNWQYYLIKEMLIKFLTNRTDLHSGNLGISKNGVFRYFDPVAVSGIQDFYFANKYKTKTFDKNKDLPTV